MIGFKPTFTSREAKEHRDRLISKVPAKYKPEIEQLYEWATNPVFVHALKNDRSEDWDYCKLGMIEPPLFYIGERTRKSKHGEDLMVSYPMEKTLSPSCRLCDNVLCSSAQEKVRHVVLSCNCGRLYCHKKCADDHVLKEPQCYVCKNYLIYDFKNSSLKATIVDRL
jgi:hypothetical protein